MNKNIGLLSKCLPKKKKISIVSLKTEPNDEVGTDAETNAAYVSTRASVLQDTSMSAKSGELIAIFGCVGSGKSSLIHAMLGEMRKLRGEVTVDGTAAYVAQMAWIFNDTEE